MTLVGREGLCRVKRKVEVSHIKRGKMKSEYLAKADFLRELRQLTTELYALGDFTVDDAGRQLHEAKLNGFIDAGLLLDVCTRTEMQEVIDRCHVDAFGESRKDRKKRLAEETKDDDEGSLTDWDKFDSPAFERTKK